LIFPKRIISLVPSQTELLFDLGLEDRIVGVTRFCVHPEHAKKNKKIIGGTKNVNIKRALQLLPDFILANKEENIKDQVLELQKHSPAHITDVQTVDDAVKMIDKVGHLFNKEEEAKKLISKIEKVRIHKDPNSNKRKRALYLIWKDPYMSIGKDTFIHSMMEEAGLQNILENETRYPTLTDQYMIQLNPDVILLSSEPYSFGPNDLSDLQKLLPDTKIVFVDGEMFSWYGSRMTEGIQYVVNLAKTI